MTTEPNALPSSSETTTEKTYTITLVEIEDAQCTLFRLFCTDSLDKIADQAYVVSNLLISHKIDGFNKKFDDLPPSHDPKNFVMPISVWSGLWRMFEFKMFGDYEDIHINGKRDECYRIMVDGLRAMYHYSEKLKTEHTPGEFRQQTLKRVGYRWESQWDEVWPKNDREMHTGPRSGTSSYAVQAAALYKAAELFRMREWDTLEEELELNTGNFFDVVVRFDTGLREKRVDILKLKCWNCGEGELKRQWKELLSEALGIVVKCPDGTEALKGRLEDNIKCALGEHKGRDGAQRSTAE